MNIESVDPENPDWDHLSYRGKWVVQTYRSESEFFEARVNSQSHKPWLEELLEFVVEHEDGDRLRERLQVINPRLQEIRDDG